jgi:hypothetical protein
MRFPVSRFVVPILGLPVACSFIAVKARAQQLAELPTIEVTTPSPVVKPRQAKKAAQPTDPQAKPAPGASAGEPQDAGTMEPLQLAAPPEVRNHAWFKKDEVLQPGASVRLFGAINLN